MAPPSGQTEVMYVMCESKRPASALITDNHMTHSRIGVTWHALFCLQAFKAAHKLTLCLKMTWERTIKFLLWLHQRCVVENDWML